MNRKLKKIAAAVITIASTLQALSALAYTPRTSLSDSECNSIYWANSQSGNVFTRNYSLSGGNCTWYAFGRAWELLGSRPSLSVRGAHKWFEYTQDGYERGSEPRLGAIACWSDTNSTVGHVAVVEAINGDSITFSESGWSYTQGYFKTVTRNKYNMNYSLGGVERVFQGYIYLPISDSGDTGLSAESKEDTPFVMPYVNIASLKGIAPGEVVPTKKSDISIYINGKYMPFSTDAVNDRGVILVPARDLLEAFCGEVYWNNDTKTLTSFVNDGVFTARLNSKQFYTNGFVVEADRSLTMSPDGKAMLPLRVTLNILGAQITSIDDYMNVQISY